MLARHIKSIISAPEQYAALILRVALGIMYIAHGMYKIVVLGWPATVRLFASTGTPEWAVYPAVFVELLGGLLLILGVKVRCVAVLLMPMLVGAIFFVHGKQGWIYTSPGGGWEYLAFLLVASLVVALLGNGAYSLQKRLTVHNADAHLMLR